LAITRERKEEMIAQYVELLEKTNGFVLIEFGGLSVPQIDGLRDAVRNADGHYLVAKNTLFTKALQQNGWPVPDDLLKGPVGVAFGMDNMPGVAKAILDYTGQQELAEKFAVKGGVMTGDVLDPKRVEAVSKLPTLDELRGQIAGLMISPAQGLVNAIHAATGQVVNVLQAYLDDRGAGDGGDGGDGGGEEAA